MDGRAAQTNYAKIHRSTNYIQFMSTYQDCIKFYQACVSYPFESESISILCSHELMTDSGIPPFWTDTCRMFPLETSNMHRLTLNLRQGGFAPQNRITQVTHNLKGIKVWFWISLSCFSISPQGILGLQKLDLQVDMVLLLNWNIQQEAHKTFARKFFQEPTHEDFI